MNIDINKAIEDPINSLYKTLYIVWFIVFILIFVTIGIHYVVYDIYKKSEGFYSSYDSLKYTFFILIFMSAGICLYLRKWRFSKQTAKLLKDWNNGQVKSFPYVEILEKYSINIILSIVLIENSIAIGFIFSLLTRSVILFYISTIVSICLMVYCIPKKSEIKTLINYK